MKVKIDRAVFRYIEHELYSYNKTIWEMEQLRGDIIEEPSLRENVSGTSSYVSDPTARKATRLVTNTTLVRMVRVVSAIDKALSKLSDTHQMLFYMKYQQDLPWRVVCESIPVSERSYFRIRRELVAMVAVELGLADID